MSSATLVNFSETIHTSAHHLPFKALEDIIYFSWHLPLSGTQRVDLMKNMPLVNSDFYTIFRQVSMTDVIIPHPKYILRLFQILKTDLQDSLSLPKSAYNQIFSANKACRSITFTYHLLDVLQTTDLPWCQFSDNCLEGRLNSGHRLMVDHAIEFSLAINMFSLLPNLTSVAFQLVDIDVDRALEFLSAIKLPPKVKDLTIETYEFDPQYMDAACCFRCGSCEKVDIDRSWKGWKMDLRHVDVLRIMGTVEEVIDIGAAIVPDRERGGSVKELDLVACEDRTLKEQDMMDEIYARVYG
ncbi:hypothetical protein AX16_009099 [Volvariella volvacea WC 439]|nr:hypothetical protein AX16_009099 [Volvariella volvacea WC 439]